MNYESYHNMTSNQKHRICNGDELQETINQLERKKLQLSSTNNNKQSECKMNNNNITVTNYALNYAADYQYPPFKLECEPKSNDKKQDEKLVNELLKYIRNDFLYENLSFSKPILVDTWWIDFEGNIQLIIKTTELYVYLCKKERYPSELINININPISTTHLPPLHTIILK
ncbi:unnamed protein product [Rotaria sp. Silwood1]|nr:unnamed protein product [Rotaria sp. Silwood1]CAF1671772.1 unnamed protein product [Rotaria sp. Silwood1]CAF3833562.1 unnamed protein product [Rotaria sp. Silwood1]CAF3855646.1 unnamed protein product [Rotaria sp. Silwood1]CAF4863928.1 unnamed protein product [Rotaria sp. Silwood1]